MELLQRNPFSTIKANDLNDSEINEQWVDIQGEGFIDLFCPSNPMSQYILGGKGSGKTHLMRYFSYKSQLDRNAYSPLNGIEKDGYFGVYFLASGLNGSRFEHLPMDVTARNAIFEYSFELWFAGLVLEALIELNSIDNNLFENELLFCNEVCGLFSRNFDEKQTVNNILSLKKLIVGLSNHVDLEVNNAFFKKDLDVEILTNRGALIFGIPSLLAKYSPSFKNVTFMYLVDELENISRDQQKYINTLVREKRLPVSFRVGARRHGIKTWETLGAGESNREDHEFAKINLDNVFGDNNNYENFAVNLIINRLKRANLLSEDLLPEDSDEQSNNIKKQYLVDLFEKVNLEDLIEDSSSSSQSHSQLLRSFKSRLDKASLKLDSEKIIENLECSRNPLVEKATIHIFCQYWHKRQSRVTPDELVTQSGTINGEVVDYIEKGSPKTHPIANKFDYYINNYIASCLRVISQNNLDQYHGFENLLKISKGFPRHILTVLRHIYRLEVFNGSMPFVSSSKISLKSQKLALKESSDWFYDDCVSEGELGTSVGVALSRLCEILRIEMYADKPVECSASGFTVDKARLSESSRLILDWAELIRVIVPADNQRQEKNSQKLVNKYHVNGLLCPRWGLSLARRGAITFSSEDIEKILDPSEEQAFINYRNDFISSRNAPFNINETHENVEAKKGPQMGLDL